MTPPRIGPTRKAIPTEAPSKPKLRAEAIGSAGEMSAMMVLVVV